MKNLSFIIVCTLIICGFWYCKKGEDNNKPGQDKQEYKGTVNVVIRYYDYNPYTGQDEFIEEKQYSYNVFVFIDPPKQSGTIAESNPFSLQIGPDRTVQQDEEGHIDISSCVILSIQSGDVLLQYWNYTLVGEQITGTLHDNHLAEAAAANLVWAWDDIAGIIMTMSFPMANGTTMTGTINANAVSLTITGQSANTYRKFTCQINAVPQ